MAVVFSVHFPSKNNSAYLADLWKFIVQIYIELVPKFIRPIRLMISSLIWSGNVCNTLAHKNSLSSRSPSLYTKISGRSGRLCHNCISVSPIRLFGFSSSELSSQAVQAGISNTTQESNSYIRMHTSQQLFIYLAVIVCVQVLSLNSYHHRNTVQLPHTRHPNHHFKKGLWSEVSPLFVI